MKLWTEVCDCFRRAWADDPVLFVWTQIAMVVCGTMIGYALWRFVIKVLP